MMKGTKVAGLTARGHKLQSLHGGERPSAGQADDHLLNSNPNPQVPNIHTASILSSFDSLSESSEDESATSERSRRQTLPQLVQQVAVDAPAEISSDSELSDIKPEYIVIDSPPKKAPQPGPIAKLASQKRPFNQSEAGRAAQETETVKSNPDPFDWRSFPDTQRPRKAPKTYKTASKTIDYKKSGSKPLPQKRPKPPQSSSSAVISAPLANLKLPTLLQDKSANVDTVDLVTSSFQSQKEDTFLNEPDDTISVSSALTSPEPTDTDELGLQFTSSKDGQLRCPVCNTYMPKGFQFSEPAPPKLVYRARLQFCRTHDRDVGLAEWKAKGFPEINWSKLRERIDEMWLNTEDILWDRAASHFRDKVRAVVESGKVKSLLDSYMSDEAFASTPGYYGSKGAAIMNNMLMSRFAVDLKYLSEKDKLIRSIGAAAFVQTVLVPELAVFLIMKDLDRPYEEAVRVMTESQQLGELLNDEDTNPEMDPPDVMKAKMPKAFDGNSIRNLRRKVPGLLEDDSDPGDEDEEYDELEGEMEYDKEDESIFLG
ncbi:MAG: hypothetical protein M1814_001517 [Vezdaea aestivalis]|nr:MAG: hypothetical protein M1814_001517 [Vezdaea aestivalis]